MSIYSYLEKIEFKYLYLVKELGYGVTRKLIEKLRTP